MLENLFHIPGTTIAIHSYGVMMVVGFLLAVHWGKYLSQKSGLDGEVLINVGIISLVAGIIGARMSHVLENWSQYTSESLGTNLWNMINISSGGLTYYGGFLLATPAAIAYGLYKKFPIRIGMDIVAPCLMIGLGMGRVGCFLNGCCYGAECNVPWAVSFPYGSNAYVEQYEKTPNLMEHPPGDDLLRPLPAAPDRVALVSREDVAKDRLLAERVKDLRSNPVHPAQLYSTITALLLAAMLSAYYTIPHAPGRVFAMMLILEGATRFLLEMLRSEPAVGPIAHWSLSMYIGVALVIAGIGLWFVFGKISTKRFPPERNDVRAPSLAM